MWRNLCVLVLGGWIAVGSISEGNAEDWPMWRFDAGRTAASSEVLPDRLMLQWTLALTARRQTWDDALNRDLMTYDRIFEPVVAEGRLFLAFNDRDKVVAYDVSTGTKLWTCFASGPVRLPPVVWQGHVYFASDDGNLYCVTAATGEEKWRFRGGPDARQVLGNQRLVSAWPMRGGPVIRDGQIYMAASIWPFMGVFIYALDAKTGDVLWVNDDTGSEYVKNVKKTPSFGSIAPQGALVATENLLLVPGGRTVPAVFDRGSGRMEYYGLATAGKGVGGSFVAANETNWFVHTRLKGTLAHDLTTGEKSAFSPNQPVLAPHFIYSAELDGITPVIRAYDAQTHAKIWETAADGRGDLILAGQTLYAAGHGLDSDFDSASPRSTLTAIRLPTGSQPAKILWTQSTEGTVERLAAANQRLFAVTREGHVLAFGAGETTRPTVHREIEMALAVSETAAGRSAELLQAGDAAGYAIWLGAADAATIEAIALSSSFVELAVFDEDTARVRQLRNRLDGAGLYGRVTAHSTIWDEFAPPPYVANMIFVAPEVTARGIDQPGWLTRLYGSVRPYGGVMHVLAPAAEAGSVHRKILAARLERADVKRSSHGVIVRRVGPLPGAGTWTHRYGDIANSIKSSDERVKLPLGILWFGGASHDDVLPRHGHGPPEQVVGGRLFIEGINQLTARDVYTGRMLWQRQFKDFGTSDVFLDATYADTPLDTAYNQVHIPGSNARGTNYVVTPDRLYAVEGDLCHVLDPATGKSLREIRMPALAEGRPNDWGYLGVYEDVLIGGTGFANYRARYAIPEAVPDATISRNRLGFGLASLDRAGSLALVGFNRYTGEPLWKIEALHSFWHNGIVAGHGLVYALDKNPQPVEEFLRRRGESNPTTYRILAFDVRSGKVAWESRDRVFGTWLGYSEEHDLLLQAGAAASDRLAAEVGQGMAVLRGASGESVWRKDDLRYSGPCVLYHDLIITNADQYAESAGAYYLKDGSQKMVTNPLTGEQVPWKITRAKGCNTIVASENLLTFRSETAAFFDLITESGTGHFGGFRSGCTTNLVVADGVLNAPDYTRTCSCGYQNQTSLALVHMPDLDVWSVTNTATLEPSAGPLRKIGINFGAPGHRRDASGLMWMEFPNRTGETPYLRLDVNEGAQFYSDPTFAMRNTPLPWVVSSGVEGVTRLRLGLRAERRITLSEGLAIEHSDDDANESATGEVRLNSSGLELGGPVGITQIAGLRFQDLPLDAQSHMRSAHLQFVCRGPATEPCELTIRAEWHGNALRFSNQMGDLSRRQLTKEQVRWNCPAWTVEGESGPLQRTPDLTPLLREVLSHPDWKPGNSIVFVIRGSGPRLSSSYLGPNTATARLIVDADETSSAGAEGSARRPYRVRLHFGCPPSIARGTRVFDVDVAGQAHLTDITLTGDAAGSATVHRLDRVMLGDFLELEFRPKAGLPLVSGIALEQLDE